MDLSLKDRYTAARRRIIDDFFSRMNPMQKQAVYTLNGPVLILAGAGSGKTTVIINRIANMVLFGDAYHSTWMPEPGHGGGRRLPRGVRRRGELGL